MPSAWLPFGRILSTFNAIKKVLPVLAVNVLAICVCVKRTHIINRNAAIVWVEWHQRTNASKAWSREKRRKKRKKKTPGKRCHHTQPAKIVCWLSNRLFPRTHTHTTVAYESKASKRRTTNKRTEKQTAKKQRQTSDEKKKIELSSGNKHTERTDLNNKNTHISQPFRFCSISDTWKSNIHCGFIVLSLVSSYCWWHWFDACDVKNKWKRLGKIEKNYSVQEMASSVSQQWVEHRDHLSVRVKRNFHETILNRVWLAFSDSRKKKCIASARESGDF